MKHLLAQVEPGFGIVGIIVEDGAIQILGDGAASVARGSESDDQSALAISELVRAGSLTPAAAAEAFARLGIDPDKPDPLDA